MYLLDSDVLISAKNAYYAFKICPGFWASLIDYHKSGKVYSLDRVRQELMAGREDEDLVLWVKKKLPDGFFLNTRNEKIVDTYQAVMLWVLRNNQYDDNAKAKFATEADGWLVAYAKAHDMKVVTLEQPRPESRSRILLPDVCRQFDVQYLDTFVMLRLMGARYIYAG